MQQPPSRTLFWHDYETFGADPRRDRPAQFAGVRTDEELNIIGEPLVLYCKPADDYIPNPDACLVTGITPQEALREGLPEVEFIGRILREMAEPGTCSLGYNTLRFDDELTRHTLYRNLYDPYGREWQNNNSRWDLIDVVRATYAFRPQGIEWPLREDGAPSFRLEHLSAANGLEHANAHDALSDVYATIELARLIRQRQPRLYDYLYQLRDKRRAAELLDVVRHKPVLHVSSKFAAERGCTALVVPLAMHPTNKNGVIVYDLSQEPSELLRLDVDAIRRRLFTPSGELADGETRIPLKVIHLNRSPVIMPLKVLETASEVVRAHIDKRQCERHWQQLMQAPALPQKVAQVFQAAFPAPKDPDLMLYSGAFFGPSDKQVMEQIRNTPPEALAELQPVFQDARLEEMFFRYRARNYPETLSWEERQQWDEQRWARMNSAQDSSLTLQQFGQRIQQLSQSDLSVEQQQLLEDLYLYVESILPADAF